MEFSHSGTVCDARNERAKPVDFNGYKIHLIWFKYVNNRNVIKEADHVYFGSLMLIDYGMKIFMICLTTFSG